MAYLGWLEYDGVEVCCDERALAYLDSDGCGDGVVAGEPAGVLGFLGVEVGEHPVGSEGRFAPWLVPFDDDAFLTGTGVYGFIGLALDGAAASPRKRTMIPAVAGDGGTPGPDRADPREIEARLLIVAADEAAAGWGLNWLAEVFTYGRPPATTTDTAPPRWGNTPRAGGLGPPLRLFATGAAGPDALRTLFDVAMLEGPTVEATHTTGDGLALTEVSLTLSAGVPYFYRPVRQVGGGRLESYPNAYTGSGSPITWVMSRDRAARVRGADLERDQCGAGPLSGCPDPIAVPDPISDTDACSATTPMVPRYALLALTAELSLPARQECVPVVVVDTGSAIMRRFSVRVGRRRPGSAPDAEGASLIWEINVPFLPANARLSLDGRTGTAVVHCDGSYLSDPQTAVDSPPPVDTYEPAVYGIRSGPVVWPVWQGAEDLTITAHAEDDYCADDARVTLFVASRTDTA